MGGIITLDAVDGWVARRLGLSRLGKHVDRLADHATELISYFGLGYPIVGGIQAVRDTLVDAAIATGRVNEESSNISTIWSRGGYGLLKAATFMAAPLSHFEGGFLAYASTAYSVYRAADLARHTKK